MFVDSKEPIGFVFGKKIRTSPPREVRAARLNCPQKSLPTPKTSQKLTRSAPIRHRNRDPRGGALRPLVLAQTTKVRDPSTLPWLAQTLRVCDPCALPQFVRLTPSEASIARLVPQIPPSLISLAHGNETMETHETDETPYLSGLDSARWRRVGAVWDASRRKSGAFCPVILLIRLHLWATRDRLTAV